MKAMKKKYSIAICVFTSIVGFGGVTYGQTDYILENNRQFMPPNCPVYTVNAVDDDSMSVIYWKLPPVLKPGMTYLVQVKWKFWTNHVPVFYMNYFGDWNPNVELAQSQMYGGIPSCDEEFIDVFTFTVPTTPGWYRIRFMARGWYDPVTSFYGTSGVLPNWYSEILFHSGYNVKVEEKDVFPSTYEVSQNFPNPARMQMTIQYQIPTESNVRIIVYNTAGQIVKTLINGERIKTGNYNIVWDGKDSEGKEVSTGTYFYTLDVNGKQTSKKAILLK
ncbi:MAG: T9SS type A sorting domain-containing protein [Candidatus Stahlbacteria bacterium]|nr:T9SS type A sorting domain-containing protein [Candidatus Stahlbacteria bacterium]